MPAERTSSAVIELPEEVLSRREERTRARRLMPFVYVHCPAGHVLRMPAEAIAQGRECFCPHCRKVFTPSFESVERALYRLDIGTRSATPLPPILADVHSRRRRMLPAGLRIALRRGWRRLRRAFD